MQQTVRLLGDLGERYGSEHKYHDLRSPADALKLLCINKPELAKEMKKKLDAWLKVQNPPGLNPPVSAVKKWFEFYLKLDF